MDVNDANDCVCVKLGELLLFRSLALNRACIGDRGREGDGGLDHRVGGRPFRC